MNVLNVGSFWVWGMEGEGRVVATMSEALSARGHDVLTLTSPGSVFSTVFLGRQEMLKIRGSWDLLASTRVRQMVAGGGFEVVLVHSPADAAVVLRAVKGRRVKVVYCRHSAKVLDWREASFCWEM